MDHKVDIETSIITTVLYFDIFDYPLTTTEIHQYLLTTEPVNYSAVLETLNASEKIRNLCGYREGFYFMKNNLTALEKRRERYLLAEKKFRVVKKNIRLLRRLPFIRAIFVCNKLAYSNSREPGDIDLAIVTAPGHIWTARFAATVIMKLLNRRPSPKNQKNKICLSFFISGEELNLQSASLGKEDWHFAFWIRQFLPVYDPENFQARLQTANNWINQLLPNLEAVQTNTRRRENTSSLVQKFLERLCSARLENQLKKIQLKLLNPALAAAATKTTAGVIITDQLLKLHLTDRRAEYNAEFEKRRSQLQL